MQSDPQVQIPAGFWTRLFAMLLDSLILACIMAPMLYLVFGPAVFSDPEAMSGMTGFVFNYVLPCAYTVLFWKHKSATPGKLLMGVSVVDARTGGPVPTGRLVLRYIAYMVSALPLLLGFIWVAFDKRKQGFHDKIADTLVVHKS